MVQGGMSCIKYLMFVFNFIFVVCGIALIVIGAVVQKQDFTVFLNNKYVTAPTILIVVGVIIFVLAFLGCCGAIRENHCMVMAFGIMLFLVFIIEIAGGITAYVNRNELENILKDNMNNSIKQAKGDAKTIWNEMQSKWECCGVEDYHSYNGTLPDSCCPADQVDQGQCPETSAYKVGCFGKMLDAMKNAIGVIGGVAIGIAVIELLGVMFSWCLASAIKKEYEGV
jgi:CD63 antigen